MSIKSSQTRFVAPLGYLLFFFLVILLLQNFVFAGLLDRKHFLNWDAEHYYWIKERGYLNFRVAFFPLFPFLWKLSHLGIYGIAIFNALLFALFFFFLCRELNIHLKQSLLLLSIPSFCFFFLPYSESVFFASSVILLLGLKKGKQLWLLTGLLLCSLARPAFTVFIPALLIVEILSNHTIRKKTLHILSYLVVTGLGLLLVGLVQYYYTGEWFEFFAAQKGWGNELQIPKFPLTSWGGDMIVRLDGTALLIGAVAGTVLLLYFLKARFLQKTSIPTEVLFSLCYLAGISLTVLIFRGGSLFSLNRFVFATPFIVVALNYYLQQDLNFTKKQMLAGFFLLLVYWLAFGSYVHIQTQLKYALLSLYLFLLVLIKLSNARLSQVFFWSLVLINMVFQMIFFVRFLEGKWVA